jgi:hypothetical protein
MDDKLADKRCFFIFFIAILVHGLPVKSVSQTTVFQYTGWEQPYTVPEGVTQIRIEAAGAKGGDASASALSNGRGGKGAIVMVTAYRVIAGASYKILVGGQGQSGAYPAGGWPGGGNGGRSNTGVMVGSGGGFTKISQKDGNFILVAGGGGGAGGAAGGEGGDGGEVGQNGADGRSFGGYGATQAIGGGGGAAKVDILSGSDAGTSENGGAGGSCSSCFGGGGGGGGWFGGGGGAGSNEPSSSGAGGGGGVSSWSGCSAVFTSGANNNDGYVRITVTGKDAGVSLTPTVLSANQESPAPMLYPKHDK